MLTEKDYCDKDLSATLMEMGFRGFGHFYYEKDSSKLKATHQILTARTAKALGHTLAISLYEAQKWLREEKGMLVDSMVFADNSIDADGKVVDRWIYYSCAILNTLTAEFIRSYDLSDEYDTYEEALSEGIKKAVKILKEK